MTDEILTIREMVELLKLNEKTTYKLALAKVLVRRCGWGVTSGFKVKE